MPIGNGGIIGPANVPTLLSAKGVWSLREAQLAQRQGIWPLGLIPDPYFEYTTLLLPGNGTNGATNNTFLDASTNNFTITRNGNTTQGTFSPFSQTGWGNYFTGSGRLALGINSAFDITQGNFTVEAWVNISAYTAAQHIAHYRWDTPSSSGWILRINATTGYLQFSYIGGSSVISTSSVPLNSWVHVAACRSGGTCYLFINGTPVGSASFSNGTTNNTIGLRIGADYNGTENLIGYMSNFRLVKNGALYTSSFTPSTTPLTTSVSSGTVSVLICQSNRFIDNSSNAFAITQEGSTTSVVAFSPFNPLLPWSAATYGGSGYFDGNGDYLSNADNANLRLGTNAFTIQGWVYRNASGATHSIIAKGGASTGFVFQITSTNILRFTHGTTNVDTTTTIPASAWTHVAAVRTNTSTNGFQLYINGVSSATATVSTDFNQTDTLYTGADRSAANVMNGYISGLKYTNGTAESISVPTAPPTATTNVTLLLNFTNAGIYDATSKNDLETVGNAQISTTQSKWGGSSMSFDGNGDYLFTPSSVDFVFNGDFTIEFWVYRAGSSAGGTGNYESLVATYNGSTGYGVWWLNTTNVLHTRVEGTTADTTTALSNSTWYHVAVTRSGSTVRTFVNGVQGSSFTSSATASNPGLYIGAQTVNKNFNGYIQDLRITKGYARYTSNFTPPTAAFPTL
jgi:hypothetical protein